MEELKYWVRKLIPRAPEEVWAFYNDIQNWPNWSPGLVEAKILSGPHHGPGAKVYWFRYAGGREVEFPLTVPEYVPPRYLTGRWTLGELAGEDSFELEPCEVGTRMTYLVNGGPSPGSDGALSPQALRASWRQLEASWESAFELFAKLLEPGGEAPSSERGTVTLRAHRCGNCGAPVLTAHEASISCTYCGVLL